MELDARPTALDIVAGLDLSGCNAIVTGGATGIGYEIARAFASRGADVCIAGRELSECAQAAERLSRETGNAALTADFIDLASLETVQAFSESYRRRKQCLHILINNAGIMATPLNYTSHGIESQFAVNYLGHFVLSLSLLRALRRAGHARIITATSIAHRRSNIHFADINYRQRSYDGWNAYGQSNTATVLFGVEFTARYADAGITANAAMPGGVMTGLQKHVPPEKQKELGWIDETGAVSPIFKTTEQGAATAVWGAVTPELEKRGGLYLQNCAVAQEWDAGNPLVGYMPYALDPLNAKRLWEVSAAMAGAI